MLVLAGCNGIAGSNEATETTIEETTAETPTETTQPAPTLDDVDFPPGVSESSVSTDLVSAHSLSLSGESFTVDTEVSFGSSTSVTTTKVADGTALATTENDRGERVQWANDSATYSRVTENGETSYATGSQTFDRERFMQYYRMETFVEAGAYEPTEVVVRDETPLIRIEATETDDAAAIQDRYGAESVESFESTMLVDEDGRIHEMETTFTYDQDGRTNTQTVAMTTRDVGETSVERPDWVATAADQATTVDVSRTDDDQFVAVEHTGGSAIRAGAFLSVSHPSADERYETRLETDLEEGQTLYLYVENGQLRQSIDERPADADPTTISGFLYVSAYADRQELFGEEVRD